MSVVYEIKRKENTVLLAAQGSGSLWVPLGDHIDDEHEEKNEVEGSSSEASSTRVGSFSTTASSAANATAMFTLALATFAFSRALLELQVVLAANFVAFVQAAYMKTATAVLSAALNYLHGG